MCGQLIDLGWRPTHEKQKESRTNVSRKDERLVCPLIMCVEFHIEKCIGKSMNMPAKLNKI